MFQELTGVCITSIGSFVPEKIVDNSFFDGLLSAKELKRFEKTVGIKERRWAESNITASDLGFEAASIILKNNESNKRDIKSIIFLSQTSDFKIPFTSNILQDKLGLSKDVLCLDINAGCAGFVQGVSTAFSIASTLGNGDKVLLIVAETLSKILSHKDRSTSMLFGDGASAILIEKNDLVESKSYFNFFSDGSSYDAIMIPDGGFRNPVAEKSFCVFEDNESNQMSNLNLQMDGAKVFDFTLREIAPSITSLLDKVTLKVSDIDYFFFHQSNKFIINQIASKLGAEKSRVPINIDKYGNTSGVSIPLLISSNPTILSTTKRILCSGYGSGLSWGSCIIDLSKAKIHKINS